MMKRIFVAIDISDETRRLVDAYLENLQAEFQDLRVGWERAEKLHLTLKFIGKINQEQFNNLSKAVEKVADQVSRFFVQITKTGQFGKRILWLGIPDKNGNLLKIHSLLEMEAEKIGFEKDRKSFNPHLTLARLREPHKSNQLIKKHLANNFEAPQFEVSEIVIYESQLLPIGSKYTKIRSFPFKSEQQK